MILAAKVFSMNKWHPELIQKSKYKYLFWSIFVSDDTAIGLTFDLYQQKYKIMSSSSSYQRALDLFTESVIKPDIELRANAASENCYSELMEIRQHCLVYLNTLKEIHQIELADESDDIESVKIVSTKIDSMEMVFSHGEMM